MENEYKKISRDILLEISATGDDAQKVAATAELRRRDDIKKYVISFLLPNLWAILAVVISIINFLQRNKQ